MKEKFTDMLEYLVWRGDLSFEQYPFCAIDALVLAQLSYLNFDGLLSSDLKDAVTLEKLYSSFESDADFKMRCDMGAVINPKTPELLKVAAATNRFGKMEICGYETILDGEKVQQFAAMTFLYGKDQTAVTFRGTDDTLIGWQEDLNIIIGDPIPSEYSAVDYINKVYGELKKEITVIGHSKGGCMAVYGAAFCNDEAKSHLKEVFNFDGPGFPGDFYKEEAYLSVKDKVKSYYPRFDVVGMVFEQPENFKIVDSDGFTVFQHDALSWNLKGTDFIYVDNFADESRILNASFNEWINGLTKDDRRKFAKTFFDVVYASGAKTNKELEKNMLQASGKMLAAMMELPAEDRKHVTQMIHMFFVSSRNNLPIANVFKSITNIQNSNIVNKLGETIDKVKEKL